MNDWTMKLKYRDTSRQKEIDIHIQRDINKQDFSGGA